MAIGRLLDAGPGLPRTGYGVRHDRIQDLVSMVSVIVGLTLLNSLLRICASSRRRSCFDYAKYT